MAIIKVDYGEIGGGLTPIEFYATSYGSNLGTVTGLTAGKNYVVCYSSEQGSEATVTGADIILSKKSGGYNYYGTGVYNTMMIIKTNATSVTFSGVTYGAFNAIIFQLD